MLDEPETRTIRRLRSQLMKVLDNIKEYQNENGSDRCFFCHSTNYYPHKPWCLGQKTKQLLFETRIPRARRDDA